MAIKLDKIGLKDAETYIDPFIRVSVVDGSIPSRPNVIDTQDTPLNCSSKEEKHVKFSHTFFLSGGAN